jgi:hypothetical protein
MKLQEQINRIHEIMEVNNKDSKFHQIIYDYIDSRYHPDYNWGPELHDFYREDVKRHRYYDFTINDAVAYTYIIGNELVIHKWVVKELNTIFNDLWLPIFIKWFEENSGLKVEKVDIN